VYTGAIGFASPVAGLELSVAIRTFEFAGDRAWLGVGGGIVADSDPQAEVAECATKAGPLLAAIGAHLAPPGRPVVEEAPPPHRLGPRPVARPDPRAGVFETLLAVDARPVALDLHLARLEASVRGLYGRPLPPGLAARLRTAAAERPDAGRLRLSVRPGAGRSLEVAIVATRLPGPRPPVRLQPTTVPGGLGAHKWSDRRLLDALTEAVAPEEPLLCDLDGHLLETARANVFLVERDGALVTPPVAGRLLPGVTRTRVIAHARRLGLDVRLSPSITLGALRRAREVFVTGALGGVEVVASCDADELEGGREVADLLGRALAETQPERGSERFSKIAITDRDRFSE
ncbi:MAG TPA: aminotransferase class IV, partial [Solirubrobacteraceae bacterium]|nr:aminotransferase class IV [Solirubrobacteraceae bacterium]